MEAAHGLGKVPLSLPGPRNFPHSAPGTQWDRKGRPEGVGTEQGAREWPEGCEGLRLGTGREISGASSSFLSPLCLYSTRAPAAVTQSLTSLGLRFLFCQWEPRRQL
jgi:hypothetical protein